MGINCLEDLLGSAVVDNKKQPVAVASIAGKGKVVGFYFAARWNPQSCGFTLRLAKFYTRHMDRLQIVFVSSDENIQQWNTMLAKMPWLAVHFSDKSILESLTQRYNVTSLPTLVLVDPLTGETIHTDACDLILGDPSGDNFPWHSDSCKLIKQ